MAVALFFYPPKDTTEMDATSEINSSTDLDAKTNSGGEVAAPTNEGGQVQNASMIDETTKKANEKFTNAANAVVNENNADLPMESSPKTDSTTTEMDTATTITDIGATKTEINTTTDIDATKTEVIPSTSGIKTTSRADTTEIGPITGICTCGKEDDTTMEEADSDGNFETVATAKTDMPQDKISKKGRDKGKGIGKGRRAKANREQHTETLVKVAETGAELPISEEELMKIVTKLQKKYRKAQKDMCCNCKSQGVTKIHTTLKVGEKAKEYNMQMYLFDLVNLAREGMPPIPSRYLN